MGTILQQRAADKFKGVEVDVLYRTSNGEISLYPEEAMSISERLSDKTITPIYRDGKIREWAKSNAQLRQILFLMDYCKSQKQRKVYPLTYEGYVSAAKNASEDVLSQRIWEFMRDRVYRQERLVMTGQPSYIYTFSEGVTRAIFVRRYKEGIVWQVEDKLIFTCPTHIELMSGTFRQIFKPIFE